MSQKLPLEEFEQIVRLTPLVSIDLVVRTATGKLLLGRRSNEPAKGCYFVPGGRIYKDERLEEAFRRITTEELGVTRDLASAQWWGVHQHLYPTNAMGNPGFGTHYVVLAYRLLLEDRLLELPKSQHSDYQWMTEDQALNHAEVHPNAKAYLELVAGGLRYG